MTLRRLGIDLSSKISGWCFQEVDEDNNLIKVEFGKFELTQRDFDHNTINEINSHIDKIIGLVGRFDQLFIEIGNFGNPSMTQKFSFIAGSVSTSVLKHNINIEIKCVCPTAWFNALLNFYCQPIRPYARKERKTISTTLCKSYLINCPASVENITQLTDDQTDAFWIALFGEKCYSYFLTKDKKIKEGKTQYGKSRKRNVN